LAPQTPHNRKADTDPHESLASSLAAFLGRMTELIREDPHLRQLSASLARALLRASEDAAAPQQPQSSQAPPTAEHPPVESAPAEEPTIPLTPALREQLRQIEPALPSEPAAEWQTDRVVQAPSVSTSPEVLLSVERRCRLKAEACRWVVRREQLMAEGADYNAEIEPQDADLIRRAKSLPECFLWMCHPSTAPMADAPERYEVVADCFELCADASQLLRSAAEEDARSLGLLEPAIDLAAEAQSMLRVAVVELGVRTDLDQQRLFDWLRSLAHEEQIFIRRFMRLTDKADPAEANSLRERTESLDRQIAGHRDHEKHRRSFLNKVRYHVKQIREHPERDHDRDWQVICETLDNLIDGGVPPSSIELRDLLLPVADDIPDEAAARDHVQLVLREIDRYLASRPTLSETTTPEPTPAVRHVRRCLSGSTVLIVGGESRPAAREALKSAFDLNEVIWMKTREHNPRVDFEPFVRRSDVSVVLLAIRWSRHCFEDVKISCDKHGKPLVRLPRGYSPNQVAEEIMAQASEQLGASADRSAASTAADA